MGYQTARAPLGRLLNVIFITEAWLGTRMDVPPSEDPRRIEVLTLSHYAVRERRLELVSYEMIRDGEGKLIDLVLSWDTRQEPKVQPQSGLIDGFMEGYHDGRRGRIPPVNIPRG